MGRAAGGAIISVADDVEPFVFQKYYICGFNFTANSPISVHQYMFFFFFFKWSVTELQPAAPLWSILPSKSWCYYKHRNINLETYLDHSASKEVAWLDEDSIAQEAAIITSTKAIIDHSVFKSLFFIHQWIPVPHPGFVIILVAMLWLAKQRGLMGGKESNFLLWQKSHQTFHQDNRSDLNLQKVLGLQVDHSVYPDAYRNIIINYPVA